MSRALAKALTSQWAATLYAAAVSVGLTFVLGRALGPAVFGQYSYILTLASIFAIFQDGGFTTLIFRETAMAALAPKEGRPGLLSLALGHLGLVTALGLGLTLCFPAADRLSLAAAVGYYALFTAAALVSAQLKGRNNFAAEGVWRAICRTATALGAGAALLLPGAGTAAIFLGLLLGQAGALLSPFGRALRLPPRLTASREVYGPCAAFLCISAATTIYFRCDVILLRQLTDDPAIVGNYAAAYRLIEGVIMLATPLAHIFFRRLRVSLQDTAAFRQSFGRMLGVMIGLSVAAVAGGLLLGPWILTLAFGDKYVAAIPLLSWLLASLPFILPNYVLTQALVALGRERAYAVATIAAAVVNIALNLLLIPLLAAKGAALATVATEAMLCLALARSFVRDGLRPKSAA
ncbi:MAG: polysaccharide biosynthesis C-terminal domain-containing protein [Solidesulfovibrio sp. DCME]|uniref:oligosaccharide flippase family protein n=1 Tax=Solidesulfovibrio sp. DCME TaxID=3447380 RepID=UPI003D0E3DF5